MKQMTKMPERGEHDAPSDEMPWVVSEVIRWEQMPQVDKIQDEWKFSSMM